MTPDSHQSQQDSGVPVITRPVVLGLQTEAGFTYSAEITAEHVETLKRAVCAVEPESVDTLNCMDVLYLVRGIAEKRYVVVERHELEHVRVILGVLHLTDKIRDFGRAISADVMPYFTRWLGDTK